MICEAGDVIVVPFPFVDAAGQKRRPSLVLSRKAFNETSGHTICTMITTAGRTRWLGDVAINDLSAAGLQRSCVVRWKLFTLPNEIILRQAGRLSARDHRAIIDAAPTIMI